MGLQLVALDAPLGYRKIASGAGVDGDVGAVFGVGYGIGEGHQRGNEGLTVSRTLLVLALVVCILVGFAAQRIGLSRAETIGILASIFRPALVDHGFGGGGAGWG